MPRRSRRRQHIDTDIVQELQKDFSARFQEPKERKGLRLRDVVALMQEQLRDAIRKNWSYQDCCELLAEKNIHISPSTLQQYLRELSPNSAQSAQPNQSAQSAQTNQSIQTSSQVDEEEHDMFAESANKAEESDGEASEMAKRFNTLDRNNL